MRTTTHITRRFLVALAIIVMTVLPICPALAQTGAPTTTPPATQPPPNTDPQSRVDPAAQQQQQQQTPATVATPEPRAAEPQSPQQSQSQPPAPSEFASDLVVLPTFEVVTHKDIGYIAVDSLAGGRSSIPIKLTPSAMSSLTRTFIDDVSVTNVRDALQWSLNVIPSDAVAGKTGSPFNNWDYNFRGVGQSIQGGSGPTRNYFTFYQVADAYNIERIEFDRGPNSILFGIGTLGGVLSIYTKQPRTDRDLASVTATVDSNYAWRFEADVNKRLSPKVAIRVNGLVEDERGWLENDHNRQYAADLAVTIQLAERTRLRIDGEVSKSKVTLVKNSFGEDTVLWDGTTIADTAGTVIPTTRGITNQQGWSGNAYLVYQPANPAAGLQNYITSYRTVGSGLKYAPYSGFYRGGTITNPNDDRFPNGINTSDLPRLPSRDFTYGDGVSDITYANLTAWFEHQFTRNLDLTVSFYRYTDRNDARNYEGSNPWTVDINKQLPDGTANPNFGKRYGDFFLSRQVQTRGVTEGRAQINWQFEKDILKQRFSVAGGYQEIKWGNSQYLALDTDTVDASWRDHLIWGRYYIDNPNEGINLPETFNGNPVNYLTLKGVQDWFDFDETHKLSNVAAVSHTRLWDDHLSILAGIRYDDYQYDKLTRNMGVPTSATANDTTYSAGAVYYIHGLPWLGVFGNYSRNFDPINPGRSLQLDGTPLGAAEGKGYDYGIRISTKDGKYYASLSRYDGKSSGRAANDTIYLAGIWKNYFKSLGLPEDYDPARSNLNYSDTQATKVSGYEFEVTANPFPSLRIMASLALPESEISDAFPGQRAYYAQYITEWQNAVAAGLATPAGTTTNDSAIALQNDLISAQNKLDNMASGQTTPKLVDYTANVFANYTFLEGPMKGFSVGAGASFVGKQYLGTIREIEYYADSRYTTNLVLAYTMKIFGYDTRFALNVDNVLNDRDAVITSFDDSWRYADGGAVPNGYYLQRPITFRLSARIMF